MFQNDYVLRMIEMMGNLLRRIRDLLDEKEKELLLDGACKIHCGMSFDALSALSSSTLGNILPENARLFASELFYVKSAAFSGQEKEYRLKSLRLLLSLREEGPLCEARAQRVIKLEGALEGELNCDDELSCAAFLMQGNAFDAGEDAIFRALALAGKEQRESCFRQGMALLEAASQAEERDLALCNTSPIEMREAMRDLEAEYTKKDWEE